MINLKNIISYLDDGMYKNIETELIKNKAENFLYLFQSYRTDVRDSVIIENLSLNSNSFYVLKSRLYDKIQEHLSGDINNSKEEIIRKLNEIAIKCSTEPREVVTAYLQKLEKDLLKYDMHNELIQVYGALKKINLYSDKYFHYSQLFNKHIAFSLSIEKSEEILGNFNRILGSFDFSRSPKFLETLIFIRKDITDHCSLNPSRQVEIIKNFIELQLCIFCQTDINKEINTEEMLKLTRKLIEELPDSSLYKTWVPALDYLFFEYYNKIGESTTAAKYFAMVQDHFQTILLHSNICKTSKFLISKICYLQAKGQLCDANESEEKTILFDPNDTHAVVMLKIYESMISFSKGNIKDAINKLNEVLNEHSFKDYFHINTEVKLTLVFFYLEAKNNDLADSILKSIYRKIKTEKLDNYSHVLNLIKLFDYELKADNKKTLEKQRDLFTLFCAKNKNEVELIRYLIPELGKKYN